MILYDLIREDIRQKAVWCYGAAGRRQLLKALLTDGTSAMIIYRLMQWSRRCRLCPLELFFNKFNAVVNRCVIGRGADFGPGFVLIHSLGVVINGRVRGGERIFVEHGVTIGAEQGGFPTLGCDVFVGAGAKIIGPLSIGDGARIGANAVVHADVPAHATAVGVPARIILRDGRSAARLQTDELPDEAEPGNHHGPRKH
jgi:serine O-acetyltransferase